MLVLSPHTVEGPSSTSWISWLEQASGGRRSVRARGAGHTGLVPGTPPTLVSAVQILLREPASTGIAVPVT